MEQKKEKLWNKNYLRVMATNTLLYFAFYLLTPLLPIYLSEQFGATKDVIGLVLSGYSVAALVIRPFSGFVVDSFSRKRVLMVCLTLFFAFFLGYIVAGTLLMFAIVRTLHGAPFGAVTVANSTCAIDVLPSSRRSEGIGYYGLSNNLAMAVAPSAGIYLYKFTGDFQLLFWLAFVIALLAVIIAGGVKLPAKAVLRNRGKLSWDRFFLVRGWLLAVNISLFGFCFGVLSNYLAIYSKQELGFTGGTGTYFLLLAGGLAVSRLQGGQALRKGRLTQNAGAGILLSLCGYATFVIFHNMTGYYASAILIGLGNGHMYPAFLNMFVNVAKHNERGTANSSILTAWDLGFGIGILLAGIVAEHAGFIAAFWMVAAVNGAGALLFFAATKSFFLQRKRS